MSVNKAMRSGGESLLSASSPARAQYPVGSPRGNKTGESALLKPVGAASVTVSCFLVSSSIFQPQLPTTSGTAELPTAHHSLLKLLPVII